MFIEKMTDIEKETLKKLCDDHKIYQLTETEAKKEKEKVKEKIKAILEKYGYNGVENLDIYSIDYKEVSKPVIDSDKLKKDGLYESYTKIQTTKPLTIR